MGEGGTMKRINGLEEGEYIGHEVSFLDKVPSSLTERMERFGFEASIDGFWVPVEQYELFCALASPYKVVILQCGVILGGVIDIEARKNQILDMINSLKKAGVNGIENWIAKVASYIEEKS